MLFCKGLYFDQSHFKRFDHVIPDIYNISRVLMVCKMDTPKQHLKKKKKKKERNPLLETKMKLIRKMEKKKKKTK